MYTSSRIVRTSGMRTAEGAMAVHRIVSMINERHGGTYAVGTMVGGDPAAVGVSGRFDSLGDYQRTRDGMMGDPEIAMAMRSAAGLFVDETVDTLWTIHHDGGGSPDAFMAVNEARMQMPRVTDAVAFGVEVAEHVAKVTGRGVGVATAMTGDRSRLIWVQYADSLDTIGTSNEKLAADDTYLGFFPRSESCFVPGSLTASIWAGVG